METRILLIGSAKSFMVTSIAKELRSSGFEVVQTEPDVTAIDRIENRPPVFLFYVDDPEEMKDIFVYIKDKVMEEDVSVSIIGSHDDITKVFNNIPKERVAAVFERPVNVKELGRKMMEVVAREDERLQKKRILVVDDDGTMLRTIKSWLSESYQVFMVNSGMAAITFLAKNKVDLILLDYEMPITTGPKVLEMLRSESSTASIPVMFLTVKSDKDSVMQVLKLKPEKYLLKTMPPAELLANIDEFFEKQKIDNCSQF
ncbi:response regulator [Butyrivibrio sp. DSM 10294]|uniref:response regulator n=1 Tax=Butyrivibrio sp. DSM 10294 TaxID=2972457 RepID=UPI00234EF15E|nr:response regulator [Butyrivibrio sp. DSM 10294]MDC7293358.1 response regulator [Butyrivibrio sp. DSM 10294]